jgi:glycosyltransferase involved in cell wall biosynthesis
MAKHILVISQYFYPEPFRINDICCELVKRGHRVTVVTGIPNYPEGKPYPGYGWLRRRHETWNGIEIIRLPLIPRGSSAIGLVANYLSFVVSGFFWSQFTSLKADYVFSFEVSPMTQALLGVWYAKRRQLKNCLYVQDLWPENVISVTGIKSKTVIGPIQKMVDYIYRNYDRILTTSPSFREEVAARIPDQRKKVQYWPQYAEEFYYPRERTTQPEIPDDGSFKVVFTGNIGQAQGLEVLVDGAKCLQDKGVQNVHFVIIGDGRNKGKLLQRINEYGVQNMFTVIGRQPAERIPELLAACDAAFVSFMADPLFEKTIPAKLQSYMACAMPIVAAASGETERIIREADCGLCSPIGNGDALAQNVLNMMTDGNLYRRSVNARTYFEKHFEKQMLMNEFEKTFLEDM